MRGKDVVDLLHAEGIQPRDFGQRAVGGRKDGVRPVLFFKLNDDPSLVVSQCIQICPLNLIMHTTRTHISAEASILAG